MAKGVRNKYQVSNLPVVKTNTARLSRKKLELFLRKSDFEGACWLIDSNAVDVNTIISTGDNALQCAVAANHVVFVQLLLSR